MYSRRDVHVDDETQHDDQGTMMCMHDRYDIDDDRQRVVNGNDMHACDVYSRYVEMYVDVDCDANDVKHVLVNDLMHLDDAYGVNVQLLALNDYVHDGYVIDNDTRDAIHDM
eukprot:TRINITY_DN72_c2_g1_i4.p2 TRINITY_DN72_c2_g1~~TRINITY_DN72_c2_g1_i4.p2  ORF type:complete len:112 (+),score=13.60 TRINITY_DN72_c2_g1_i4:323-658(+)